MFAGEGKNELVIETESVIIVSLVFPYGLLNSLMPKGDCWSCIVSRGQRSEVILITPQTALWTQVCVVNVHIYERVH